MMPKILLRVLVCLTLAMGLVSHSSSEYASYPIAAKEIPNPVFPIARYRDIKVDDLRKLLIDSFSEFNFHLIAVKKIPDGLMTFEFSYPIFSDGKPDSVIFTFNVDGAATNKKCANCFLRLGRIENEKALRKLPWITQYDLSSRLYPDIDRSYLSVERKSQAHIDPKHGFDYKKMWDGERNLSPYSNAYVGIKLPELKREIALALTDSGFVQVRDSNPAEDAADSRLTFSFPIDSGNAAGAVYSVQFANQFDADGLCYPCEARQLYDPHQALPPLGLSAMAGRLSLASRFESSLNKANEQIKASTSRYLRPRTQFVQPPKSAPLGSPRVPIAPVAT